jgi:magnesium transporter
MPKLKNISKNIQEIIINNPSTENNNLTWINVANAGKKEIEYLRKKYGFSLNHLQASSSKIFAQRPSFTVSDDGSYSFLIFHFPIFVNGKIAPAEIDIFKKKGLFVTIHNNNLPALNDFFGLCKKDCQSLSSYQYESSAILLYEMLRKIMLDCYRLLDESSIQISRIEEHIFSREQKEAVSKILNLRRNIINFRKIMQNHKNILKKQMERKSEIVPLEIYNKFYGELIEHSKNIWEILENQKEMIEILNDTNESLMNDRLSYIIKTLTIFSVIVFPLTLCAAIFGMNTVGSMPFVSSPYGFWYIIGIMVCGSLGMLYFFEKKKWL